MTTVTETPVAPPPARSPGGNPTLLAIGVATVIGALALPGARVGVGWPLIALAVLAAVLTARSARSPRPVTGGDGSVDRRWRVAAGTAALLLTAVPAIRAAEWLAALCLCAAAPLASYALAGGRTWLGIAEGLTAIVPAALRGLQWTANMAPSRTPKLGRIAGAATAGSLLLLVFGSLLRAADPDFARLIDSWADDLSAVDLWRAGLGGALALGFAVAAAYLVQHRPDVRAASAASRHVLAIAEWAVPLVMLDALFAVFVWVQITVLFGGNDYVLGPGGPDYAVHARGGFVQLGFVTALTLAVVAALAAWARRGTPLQARLLRGLGGVLCALTLVIVASALKRLWLYAQAYGFTVPRLLGFAGEVWLGLVFVLVLIAGIRLRGAWLPRATVAAAVLVLLGLAAVNPDALIARTVLARLGGPYPVDAGFVRDLSADALDDMLRVPSQRTQDCLTAQLRYRLSTPDPWYAKNLARERARAWAAQRPSVRYLGCYGD